MIEATLYASGSQSKTQIEGSADQTTKDIFEENAFNEPEWFENEFFNVGVGIRDVEPSYLVMVETWDVRKFIVCTTALDYAHVLGILSAADKLIPSYPTLE